MKLSRMELVGALLLLCACPPRPVASAAGPEPMDTCAVDADCSLIKEDACCVASPCDEDQRAETAARTRQRRQTCSIMDCVASRRVDCSARDVRFVAACRSGHCVVERAPPTMPAVTSDEEATRRALF